jgi:hypothetical protein
VSKGESGSCADAQIARRYNSECPESLAHTESAGATKERGGIMFLAIAVVLLVMWVLGFAAFHIAGGVIHLLIILAVISVILPMVSGRSANA